MALKWDVPTIHPEAIKQGLSLITSLQSIFNTKMVDLDRVPAIKKLNPGMMDKSSKIANLQHRIENNLLKLPLNTNYAPFQRLVEQIQEFNPEVRDGGLQHDDEIDSVCMSQFVIKGRLTQINDIAHRKKTPYEMLEEGVIYDPDSRAPILHGLDFRKIPIEKIMEWVDGQGEEKDGQSKI